MAVKTRSFQTHMGFLVHDVSRQRRTYFDRVLRPVGITRSQLVMLLYLDRLPAGKGVSQRELAIQMNMTQVSVGEKVAMLEESGCLRRDVDQVDRRQRNLQLTAHGRSIIRKSRKLVEQMNADILEGLTKSELDIAEHALELMRRNLSRLSV